MRDLEGRLATPSLRDRALQARCRSPLANSRHRAADRGHSEKEWQGAPPNLLRHSIFCSRLGGACGGVERNILLPILIIINNNLIAMRVTMG
jgi:hypothetical protein